ncbi:imidazole glycerol phosphate synthase subunit HisH [candidate division KSB1 bacterium]
MITIVDYGAGNLANVKNALDYLNERSEITSDPGRLQRARKIILPGVGAFEPAVRLLRERDLDKVIVEKVNSGVPLLGICLGMQLLMSRSSENGEHSGLDLIPGSVELFKPGVKIPQIGWNSIDLAKESLLVRSVPDGSFAYFVHGYHCLPDNESDVLAWSHYGERFAALLERGAVYGAQFHPEKSQETGLRILKNFGKI